MGINFRIISQPRDFPGHDTLGSFVEAQDIDFLSFINADRQYVTDLPLFRGFHVVRDPRDVLVSAYFSHKHSHPTENWPELIEHRKTLKRVSKAEGLLREMEFSRPFFEDMYSWNYSQENVLELRMEELTGRPMEMFVKVGRFLEIVDKEENSSTREFFRTLRLRMNRLSYKGAGYMPGDLRLIPVPRSSQDCVPMYLLRDIVEKHRFERVAGRKRGEENVQSHFRKGVPGDWRNHFGDRHVRAFKDRYNDLLLKLGYETDPDWQ
jgi:hypothetical protein